MTQPGFKESASSIEPPSDHVSGRSSRQIIIFAALTVVGLILGGALLRFITLPKMPRPAETNRAPATLPAPPGTPAPANALELIAPFTGSWQGTHERIRIDTGNGVVEILRRSARNDGSFRIDHYAAAPVRIQSAQRLLELETAEGIWRLALLPGDPRTLRIIFPDGREIRYEPA